MLNLLAIVPDYTTMVENMLNSPAFALISFISDIVVWLVGHLFLSFAIFIMCKKQGFKKLWLSFIPFINLIPLGKLVGKTTVWGVKLKNVGFWACITGIVCTLCNFLLDIGYYISLIEYIFSVRFDITNEFLLSWIQNTNIVWLILYYGSSIFDLAYIFFNVSLVFLVFRLYRPQSAILYALLAVFIEPLFGILLFTCRNNPKHVIVRPQTPYGGGYYGGGYYGGGYNNQQPPQNQQPAETPFPEFDGEDKKDNNDSDTGDGLFN